MIEAAIALIVVGVIALPILQYQKIENIKEQKNETKGAMSQDISAINQYYMEYGSYPCPASLNSKQGDADFGMSGNCSASALKLCTDPTWEATAGICRTDSTSNAVVVGAIPFGSLRMQQEESLDAWSNKLIYNVSLAKLDPTTFSNSSTMSMTQRNYNDSTKTEVETTDSGYHFIIVSTGEDGAGGFTKDGEKLENCSDDANSDDYENCDLDTHFVYDNLKRSEKIGINHYDDYLSYQKAVPESRWFKHPEYDNFTMTRASRIGVGTSSVAGIGHVAPSQSVHVEGNIGVKSDVSSGYTGNVKANEFCKSYRTSENGLDAEDCMTPEIIMDRVLTCEAEYGTNNNAGLTKIAGNEPYCGGPAVCNSDVDYSSVYNKCSDTYSDTQTIVGITNLKKSSCDGETERAYGIDSKGKVVCQAFVEAVIP